MTILIKLPGVLQNTTGLKRVIPTKSGFPEDGLTDLLLFTDGAGTSPVNSVVGRAAGTIESPSAVNNAYSWLPNGGVQLDGSQIVSLPASDAAGPWTLVSVGAITGSVGGTASERIGGLLGFKQFTEASAVRGLGLYARGSNDWNSGTPTPYHQHRAASAGAQGSTYNLSPTTPSIVGLRRVLVVSYDGSATVESAVYDKNGVVVTSGAFATNNTAMFTVGGVTVSNLNPCVGLSSATYAGGRQQVEAFARYGRLLDSGEVQRIVAAAVALGAARGRGW